MSTDDTEFVAQFDPNFYTMTDRTVYSTQAEVRDAWYEGLVPKGTGNTLYSSTKNFKGKQYRSGRGKLVHYSTYEAIRTRFGVYINNTECYARGWAKCTPLKNYQRDGSLPLSTLTSRKRQNAGRPWVDPMEIETLVEQYDSVPEYGGRAFRTLAITANDTVLLCGNNDHMVTVALDDPDIDELLADFGL